MSWLNGNQVRRAMLAAVVLAGATFAAGGSSTRACEICERAAMLQRQQAAAAHMRAVSQMYDENALNFLIGSPQTAYRPRQAPPGWEGIERNRRVMNQLYGPGGMFNADRIKRLFE